MWHKINAAQRANFTYKFSVVYGNHGDLSCEMCTSEREGAGFSSDPPNICSKLQHPREHLTFGCPLLIPSQPYDGGGYVLSIICTVALVSPVSKVHCGSVPEPLFPLFGFSLSNFILQSYILESGYRSFIGSAQYYCLYIYYLIIK